MINYNNHNISAISYNGHSIKAAVGCNGEIVFGELTPPTPMEKKMEMLFNDGGNNVVIYCNGNDEIIWSDLYTAVQEAGRNNYDYAVSVTFGNCVTTLESNLLAWRSSSGAVETLSSVTIPSNVTVIGEGLCTGRTALTTVTYPSLTYIPNYMFSSCSSLQFTIPNSVQTIGMYAFQNCTSMLDITIPSGVTSIGDNAFRVTNGTPSLNQNRSVTVYGDTPPTMGDNVFEFQNMTATYPIYVQDALVSTYQTAWEDYINITRIKPLSEK